MRRYLVRKLIFAIITLIVATIFVFGLSRMAGDPLLLFAKPGGYGMSQERIDQLSQKLGLDKPLIVQYLVWLGRVLTGDFGQTIVSETSVSKLIWERAAPTLQLAVASFILSILMGVPLGVLSAVKRGSMSDYVSRTIALVGQAAPIFWVCIMAILLFAVTLDWLPVGTSGPDGVSFWTWAKFKYLIMPAFALGWGPAAALLRLTRSAMLEVLDSEYVTLARAKGTNYNVVIWKHAFRNAVIPPLTLSGLILIGFINGTTVIETVFSWPGLGRVAVQAVQGNDFPLISAITFLTVVLYVVVVLTMDVLYAILDPRIRYA